MLRWLNANRVNYVLVGPIAEAIRTGAGGVAPVAIVAAPYVRNYERLTRALWTAHARQRVDGEPGTVPFKMDVEKLSSKERWTLRCGIYDLDIEGRPAEDSRYQELLYEAGTYHLAPDLAVDVASPEDIEHYAHIRRTGSEPEIKITRTTRRNADERDSASRS